MCAVNVSISPPTLTCSFVSEISSYMTHCNASSSRGGLWLGVSNGTGLADHTESAEPRVTVVLTLNPFLEDKQNLSRTASRGPHLERYFLPTNANADALIHRYHVKRANVCSLPPSLLVHRLDRSSCGSALPCRRIQCWDG